MGRFLLLLLVLLSFSRVSQIVASSSTNNPALSNLTITAAGGAILSPPFSPSTTTYNCSCALSTTTLTLLVGASNLTLNYTIFGVNGPSSSATNVPLAANTTTVIAGQFLVGQTWLVIQSSGLDGVLNITYNIRIVSNDAYVTSLTSTVGTFVPAYNGLTNATTLSLDSLTPSVSFQSNTSAITITRTFTLSASVNSANLNNDTSVATVELDTKIDVAQGGFIIVASSGLVTLDNSTQFTYNPDGNYPNGTTAHAAVAVSSTGLTVSLGIVMGRLEADPLAPLTTPQPDAIRAKYYPIKSYYGARSWTHASAPVTC